VVLRTVFERALLAPAPPPESAPAPRDAPRDAPRGAAATADGVAGRG